jgi:hypothetical protein
MNFGEISRLFLEALAAPSGRRGRDFIRAFNSLTAKSFSPDGRGPAGEKKTAGTSETPGAFRGRAVFPADAQKK